MEQVPLFVENPDGRELLATVPEFAKAHDIPVQTLYSAVSSGRIIYTRRGTRLYLNVESAIKFTDSYRKLTPKEGS